MAFWIGWQLWEKMCLVLGGLILLVLIYAFCVLSYNKRTIKKLSTIEQYRKPDEDQDRDSDDMRRDDIPFGARALESGIQIEGIWISNHNTPMPSPYQPGTPAGSRPPSPSCPVTHQSSVTVNLEEQKRPSTPSLRTHLNYSWHRGSFPKFSRTDTGPEEDIDQNSFVLERLDSRQRSQSETHRSPDTRTSRSVTNVNRYSEPGISNVEIYVSPDRHDRRLRMGVKGLQDDGSSEEFGEVMNRLINEKMQSHWQTADSEKDHQGDLEAMNNHRQSHVAETGQLGTVRSSTLRLLNEEINSISSGETSKGIPNQKRQGSRI